MHKLRGGVYRVPKVELSEVGSLAFDQFAAIFQCRSRQWESQWSATESKQLGFGTITLLNESLDLGDLPFESSGLEQASHLWRFQFHYHEFLLRELALLQSQTSKKNVATDAAFIKDFLLNWARHHAPEHRSPKGDVWHPYCLSRRIPVWCQLLHELDFGSSERDELSGSLIQQGICLEQHLEFDICGNHLMENLRGLGYVYSLGLRSTDEIRLSRFFEILKPEANVQVLKSGEHFEKSPMYHCQVTWIFLELAWLFKSIDQRIAEFCQTVAERMVDFLLKICHPDGEIPLFSDSCFGEAPDVRSICSFASLQGIDVSQCDRSRPTQVSFVSDYWMVDHPGGKT
ncbi:hypothetical protein OAG56_06985, partial [Mariniblastus sp.]